MSESLAASPLTCPHCGAAVNPGRQDCPECGVDLLLYADMLFRQRMEEALTPPSTIPSSIEELVPRLGESLVSQNVISLDQLRQALDEQSEARANGHPLRLGEILVRMNALTPEELDRAVAKMVAELQNALQTANRTLELRVQQRTVELSRALERLSELNQLKANFVANVSHELRTPMTHILGYLDLLADNTFGQLTEQQMDAVETIRRAGTRLYDLIEDLIQFSDTSRGEISLSLQVVSLRDVIQDAMSRLIAKAKRGNVELAVRIPPELPLVRADFRKLSWVIFQLIDNGIKFTPSGGRVEVSADVNSAKIRVQVKDTGIGIPESRLSELFLPFHQLDGSLTRKQGGTGLGLALCKQLIEAHNSSIDVHSEEAKGSIFSFELLIPSPQELQAIGQKTLPGIKG